MCPGEGLKLGDLFYPLGERDLSSQNPIPDQIQLVGPPDPGRGNDDTTARI